MRAAHCGLVWIEENWKEMKVIDSQIPRIPLVFKQSLLPEKKKENIIHTRILNSIKKS
jgi:hypothetical protein